jgi:hypothetical protein
MMARIVSTTAWSRSSNSDAKVSLSVNAEDSASSHSSRWKRSDAEARSRRAVTMDGTSAMTRMERAVFGRGGIDQPLMAYLLPYGQGNHQMDVRARGGRARAAPARA